jgi:FkbM family methyltransferase
MNTVLGESVGQVALNSTRAPWMPVKGEPVVVYGAGDFARAVVGVVRNNGGVVRHALDRRGSAASLDGIGVYCPAEDPMSATDRRNATAVVGVFNRAADPMEIEGQLEASGYGRVVGVPELYETFAESLGQRYWLARRSFYERSSERIAAALELWTDSASRELYTRIVRYRVAWSAANAPRPCAGVQYFAEGVPRTTGAVSWLDCGAFDGDTLSTLAPLGTRVKKAYAFEPDPANFARLVTRSREFARNTGACVSLWPCAVAGSTGIRRFRAAAGEASAMASDGTTVVAAVAIDDALPVATATDIKMDIEGAELEALLGAEGLIRRCCPRLAICVYHRPQDLWEIPLFVRGLGLPYDFYLRSHGHYGFDLVMYAVPHAVS